MGILHVQLQFMINFEILTDKTPSYITLVRAIKAVSNQAQYSHNPTV